MFYSKENLRFLLEDVFNAESLCRFDYFKDHTAENFWMMVEAAETLSVEHLRPILLEMDRNPPHIENSRIKVHPKMLELMKMFGSDGWISMSAPNKFGGQQAPFTIMQSCAFIMAAANYSTMAFPFLTTGAAHLIEAFGSETLQQQFIPKMYAGEWQGTMALTEPQAGSSLSDITTTAKPTEHGHYLIKGQKVFISCGDHDACDNIIHLMLARIEGAPAGTKGISLFVVPRMRQQADGSLAFNDVNTAGVFHKMGYHGAPIAHLIMGEKNDCHGWLIGEAHKGLNYMFQMMNEARIGVGLQATAISSAAYYAALEYAQTRLQGRKPTEKDPHQPQVPIIDHADVKRLLLFQKAVVEGSLALGLQATMYFDQWHVTEGDEKEENYLKLELLTPIVKSYPAEMSILSTSAALQCFGGYGFTKEYLAELFFRETRIHTLHEGTTAIHGMDLLGRKVMVKNGKAAMLLMQEISADIHNAKQHDALKLNAAKLENNLQELQQVTFHLMGVAQAKGAEVFLADATLYLELFGIVAVAWQWLKMGTKAHEVVASKKYAASFLSSKTHAMNYYFEYELPKTAALAQRLKSDNFSTTAVNSDEIV